MTAKTLALVFAAALSAVAGAQSWNRSYEAGLAAARAGKWAQAREAFQQAAAVRTDDVSKPTVLSGPATERKLWRNGAPYSPNFLAAYSLYRQSLLAADPAESSRTMREAASEFETLVAKDQGSAEVFFFLDVIYTKLGDEPKRQAAADLQAKTNRKTTFKVDTEVVAPEEVAALSARTTGATVIAGVPAGGAGQTTTVTPGTPFGAGPKVTVGGPVASIADKFALVIGQSEGPAAGGSVAYGANDAQRVRDALVSFAGYPAENVVMLQNATAAQIKAAAEDLAGKVKDEATVTIFYSGGGVYVGGKDYLTASGATSSTDTGSMVSKADLFTPFVKKGARLFTFFETNRPFDNDGGYFGREIVSIGSVSQVQSTRPGTLITPTYRDGQPIGLFANAFVTSLAGLRANRVPITEFTWLVYNTMRRGGTGTTGGGGTQFCTLPVLTNLAADSKF